MKKKLKTLFENLCCSVCKASFDENSIQIKREEDGLLVTQLVCQHCGKSFGMAFIGINGLEIKEPLEVVQGPDPINYDDVIDAHRFIKDFDKHWKDYISEKQV